MIRKKSASAGPGFTAPPPGSWARLSRASGCREIASRRASVLELCLLSRPSWRRTLPKLLCASGEFGRSRSARTCVRRLRHPAHLRQGDRQIVVRIGVIRASAAAQRNCPIEADSSPAGPARCRDCYAPPDSRAGTAGPGETHPSPPSSGPGQTGRPPNRCRPRRGRGTQPQGPRRIQPAPAPSGPVAGSASARFQRARPPSVGSSRTASANCATASGSGPSGRAPHPGHSARRQTRAESAPPSRVARSPRRLGRPAARAFPRLLLAFRINRADPGASRSCAIASVRRPSSARVRPRLRWASG